MPKYPIVKVSREHRPHTQSSCRPSSPRENSSNGSTQHGVQNNEPKTKSSRPAPPMPRFGRPANQKQWQHTHTHTDTRNQQLQPRGAAAAAAAAGAAAAADEKSNSPGVIENRGRVVHRGLRAAGLLRDPQAESKDERGTKGGGRGAEQLAPGGCCVRTRQ